MQLKALFVTLIIIFGMSAFSPFEIPSQRVGAVYRADVLKLKEISTEFVAASEDGEISELRLKFKEMRGVFKRVEFLMEYIDQYFVKYKVNGAPLPKLEPNLAEIYVLEPAGFQPLEEALYESEIDRVKIKSLALQLSRDLAQHIQITMQFTSFTDRMIFEASRLEIIRIGTLSFAGFDTPSSGNGLIEATEALKSVQSALRLYQPDLEQKNSKFAHSFYDLISQAVWNLEKSKDFDGFDRLEYFRNYLDPIFGQIAEAQEILGIEFFDESGIRVPSIVNHRAKHIFDVDLLNPFAFSRMNEEAHNDNLIPLGRTLFFDPLLSGSQERACASCHQPSKGFSDGLPKSTALNFDGTVKRNAPGLINVAFSERFFWDLRAGELEDQFDHVVSSSQEFNTNWKEIVERLNASSEYRDWFAKVYPQAKSGISKKEVTTAIAAYLISLRSWNSPIDRYVRGEQVSINDTIRTGFNLFMGKALCGTCHFAPTFSGMVPPLYSEIESEVLGVPGVLKGSKIDEDRGRAAGLIQEYSSIFEHSFKTVTVRNAALTAPYFHNGSYPTLEDVVEFYSNGGGVGLGFDVPNQTLPFDSLNLSNSEQSAIVAFMKSLTDTTGMSIIPQQLPKVDGHPEWDHRPIGGRY